jgi:pyruvate dehydrogenase E1 component alpha subunit
MLRLRRTQEEIVKEYHLADEIRCPVHFCIGQEAIPAALSLLIQKDDFLFGPHRSHGYYIAKGGTMNELFAEMYGRKTGANAGLSGSQEISSPGINFYSGAILSGLLAIAVGVGLGFQLKGIPQAAVVGFGDGATDEGIFWEAISYAQLCRLPVVFICENNGYSTYSPQLKRQVADDIHKRVSSFGLRTEVIFGNDVILAMSTLKDAFDFARQGKGPVFIESYTYRWLGHVGPENDDYVCYRPQEELDFWKEHCPVSLLENQMFKGRILTLKLKEEILGNINNEIAQAFEFAKKSPFPADMNWQDQNYCAESPLADKLLKDIEKYSRFNHDQVEAVPGPY